MKSSYPGSLMLITPPNMPVEKMVKKIRQALQGVVDTVQLRRRDLSGKGLYNLAIKLRKITRNKKARLIINDRIDAALVCGADGVHLGRNSFSPELARAILGPKMLIGRTLHSLAEFSKEEEKFLDYFIISPIFKTSSKPEGEPLGVKVVEKFKRKTNLPLYALGGITEKNIHLLRKNNCGVAVISAIMNVRRPDLAAKILSKKSRYNG